MAQILEFLRPTDAFEAEVLESLGKAFHMAVTALHYAGRPKIVRETIARRIIEAAQKGERDPAKLCAAALSAFNSDEVVR
ncbi:MAG TPA: hypothetical protein VMV59_02015 [Candidatus Dormibacteraeota bacterium]|nr:hypothetical protein [Candidatus Dormibacteraeota bacterium]